MEIISKLQPKQIEAAYYWIEDDQVEEILFGGAKGGAKSYLGCTLIFSDALTYPGTHYFIARHSLTDLIKFTTPSIYEVIGHMNINHLDYMRFNGKENYFDIYNGSRVYFLDCKHLPSDPDYHRFGSMQFTRGWLEEVGEIPSKAIINLSASVGRWKNKQYNLGRKLFMTCNPNKGYAYKEFYIPHEENTLPNYRKFIKSLPTDNKYLSKEYLDMLNRLPKNERARLLLGDWRYDDDPTKLCEYDKILDLWSNDHVLKGEKYITADIARFGKDKTDIWTWDGLIAVEKVKLARSSIPESVDAIKKLKLKHQVPMSNISVDELGVGGGVVDLLPGCYGFVANAKPINTGTKQNYANLKAQCSFVLSEYVNNAKMWIRFDDDKDEIIEELEHLKKSKEIIEGKLDVIKKEEVKSLINRSPDHQDNLLQRIRFELRAARRGIRRKN